MSDLSILIEGDIVDPEIHTVGILQRHLQIRAHIGRSTHDSCPKRFGSGPIAAVFELSRHVRWVEFVAEFSIADDRVRVRCCLIDSRENVWIKAALRYQGIRSNRFPRIGSRIIEYGQRRVDGGLVVNLTRYHGVLAPNHRWRGLVTPAKRGKGAKRLPNKEVASPAERHAAMTWAQRLKRVFSVDIEVCGRCGGSLKVIVGAPNRCIEDQDIIDRILAHLREKEQEAPARPLLVPPTRAPPATLSLFAGTELNQQGRH